MENLDIHIRQQVAADGSPYLRIDAADGDHIDIVGRHLGVDAELPGAMERLAELIATVCLGFDADGEVPS